MNEERIKEVFSDEEFVKELFSKETPEEAKALLEEKDIDFSVEDLIKLREIVIAKMEQQTTGEEVELGEDDLEDVSGGTLTLIIGVTISVLVNAAFVGYAFEKSKIKRFTWYISIIRSASILS